jgi:uncharacterized protein
MLEFVSQPWPWWFGGTLIGLTVPLLLLLGNKSFGISSSLRHICAIGDGGKTPFFKYDWRKETWNLVLVAGVAIGGFLSYWFLQNHDPMVLNPALVSELATYQINTSRGIMPTELFSWEALFTAKGLFMMVFGGFLVGFGTRYAGGCTSGHAIMGLSNLQWPSLVATVSFFLGGILMANFILPFILAL